MNPSEYQKLAARTECDQRQAAERMADTPHLPDVASLDLIRFNHAIVGLCGEVGELASLLEKMVYYGRTVTEVAIKEEVGDCFWYLALLCNALGFDMGQLMEANVAKLRARYPEKYDPVREENRDREAEAAAVESVVGRAE